MPVNADFEIAEQGTFTRFQNLPDVDGLQPRAKVG